MTNDQLNRERLEKIKSWRETYGAGSNVMLPAEEAEELARIALAAMDSEPVEPIWRATKYPVSRPVPGAKLIVWDETGKFVGYGSAVDTSESGVAIQMCDGRRFDSNHELRWQYALQPVPVVDNEPVGWTDEEELRDVNVAGIGYLFGIDREANKFADPRRQIMLYRHAQPALVPDKMTYQDGVLFVLNNDMSSIERGIVAMRAWNACRAAMLQAQSDDDGEPTDDERIMAIEGIHNCERCGDEGWVVGEMGIIRCACGQAGNSPVIPNGYVMVPMRLTAENGAKGALSGEFSETKFVNCPECFGDDECETCDGSGRIEITVPVTWTTIKEIWAKGVEHFAAALQEVQVVSEKIEQLRKKIDRCDVCTEGARGGCGTCAFNGNL